MMFGDPLTDISVTLATAFFTRRPREQRAEVSGESLTADEIYKRIRGGPGSAALIKANDTAVLLKTSYEHRADEIEELTSRTLAAWQGAASEAARSHLAPLSTVLRDTADLLDRVNHATMDQIGAFSHAYINVSEVPKEPPTSGFWNNITPGKTDIDRAIEDYNTKASRNIAIYHQYHSASVENGSRMPLQYPSLTSTETSPISIAPPVAKSTNTRNPLVGDNWTKSSADSAEQVSQPPDTRPGDRPTFGIDREVDPERDTGTASRRGDTTNSSWTTQPSSIGNGPDSNSARTGYGTTTPIPANGGSPPSGPFGAYHNTGLPKSGSATDGAQRGAGSDPAARGRSIGLPPTSLSTSNRGPATPFATGRETGPAAAGMPFGTPGGGRGRDEDQERRSLLLSPEPNEFFGVDDATPPAVIGEDD